MIKIENGVIKNVAELNPESQRYLRKLTEDLKLANEPNQFNIGFLYTYNVHPDEKWGNTNVKAQFKDIKEALKKRIPAIKNIDTKNRQEMEISEIVTLIKERVLAKIKAKEEEYLESCQSAFNKRKTLANFLRKLTIGIFGSTFFALATTALITEGYISLPGIMPLIIPIVTLVITNPIIASAALVTIMTTLFLASWKAINSKRRAEHILELASMRVRENISALNNAMEQKSIAPPTNSSSYTPRDTPRAPLQTTRAAPTLPVRNRRGNNASPHNGEDITDNQASSEPHYYTLNP